MEKEPVVELLDGQITGNPEKPPCFTEEQIQKVIVFGRTSDEHGWFFEAYDSGNTYTWRDSDLPRKANKMDQKAAIIDHLLKVPRKAPKAENNKPKGKTVAQL